MDRYHRQQILLGEEAQRQLREAHVLVVGCGALGCVSADLLVRAGVGKVTLVDRDLVELTNLQRQTLYEEADVGQPKAARAAARLQRVNTDVDVHAQVVDLAAANVERIAGIGTERQVDVIVDGTDNFQIRYVLNDLSVKHAVAYVYAGAVATRAMLMVITPESACLRCVFEHPPAPGTQPTCDTAGVLAGATAAIAARQAVEAMKTITGGPVETGLVEMDVWEGRTRRLDIGARRPACPCCGQHQFEFLDGHRDGDAATLCGRNAVQIGATGQVDLEALAARLQAHGAFSVDRYMLRGKLHEPVAGEVMGLTVFHDGRAIVEGTTETGVARGVYARYIGV